MQDNTNQEITLCAICKVGSAFLWFRDNTFPHPCCVLIACFWKLGRAARATLDYYRKYSILRLLPKRPPHPISSSVVPFSFCPQSLPASEFYPVSQIFSRGGPSTGVSGLASFLRKNTQGWSPLEGTLKSLLQHHSSKASILGRSAFFTVQLPHPYINWKNHSLD